MKEDATPTKAMHVLVADSDPCIRPLAIDCLEDEGIKVSSASTGSAMLQLPSGASWKFVEGKCGEIVSRQGEKHSKAEALRAFLTQYRRDSRPHLIYKFLTRTTSQQSIGYLNPLTQEKPQPNEFRPFSSTCLTLGNRFTVMPEARLA